MDSFIMHITVTEVKQFPFTIWNQRERQPCSCLMQASKKRRNAEKEEFEEIFEHFWRKFRRWRWWWFDGSCQLCNSVVHHLKQTVWSTQKKTIDRTKEKEQHRNNTGIWGNCNAVASSTQREKIHTFYKNFLYEPWGAHWQNIKINLKIIWGTNLYFQRKFNRLIDLRTTFLVLPELNYVNVFCPLCTLAPGT